MENWTEIRISVPVEYVDKTGDIAGITVPYGIYIEDYSNLEQEAMEIAKIDLIDEQLLAKDRTKGIVHIYISPEENPSEAVSFISDRLTAESIPYEISLADCFREDWENNWKKYFKSVPVGEKILIHPAWEEKYSGDDRVVLELEPGVAFGTGTHETTRLCLQALERCVDANTVMLDVGCGSGILSVAGLLLGAKNVVGVDIDPLAVKTAIANGQLNNFSYPQYNMICGNLTDKVDGKYNLVTANIVADAIIKLSAGIKSFLTDDAIYIVSGIIDIRADEVIEALLTCGFIIKERIEENGWVCMICVFR